MGVFPGSARGAASGAAGAPDDWGAVAHADNKPALSAMAIKDDFMERTS
jgi:hypothetical protein